MNYLWAFVVGGAICVVGQLLIDYTKLSPARILTGYLFRYTLAQRRNFPSFRSCIRINSSIIHKYSKSMHKYWIQHFAARWLPAPPEIVHFSSLHFTVFPDILTP